ncbi:hypothetical protein PL75_04815 [Neisseria arctica]|uniref:Uncharacterized protein n=1 Tax=Neisseria arctica TaxID=1470200 RepID=A0A0J0YSC6_9NEIS|nr:hypothetical protein [Neisseria arctica]KLT73004.1 hypothetical protein PL75_04815 [Neisseria arctica]UOO86718.1 sel1 repeat family protein [Neisseria arctica]
MEKTIRALIAEGKKLFNKNQYDDAISSLDEAYNLLQNNQPHDTQQKCDIQFWLGRCYLEKALQTGDEAQTQSWFDEAINHHEEQLKLASQLTDEQKKIEEQGNAQHWLGQCYLEKALQTGDETQAQSWFKKAIKHHKEELELASQLTDEQKKIEEQQIALFWRGLCYFELANQMEKSGKCSEKIFQKYFSLKESLIAKKLEIDTATNKKLSKMERYITTILATLYITPSELGEIPLAHYASPKVCSLLFGLSFDLNKENHKKPKQISKMRMGSASYMNDPMEGKSLFELLSLHDLDLQNKTDFNAYNNAFFSCFTSRINDLNQFRLYGKEDGVEASGCCLVFNKDGKWLVNSDISMAYKLLKNGGFYNENTKINNLKKNKSDFPLYQVAYIAYLDEYLDEYIKKYKYHFKLKSNQKNFGIYLQCIGSSDTWHKIRLEKLQKGLHDLIEYIRKNNLLIEEKKSLEYIRYLFKDFAFRDEEEFRLLTITKLGDSELEYCSNTNSVYMPYAEICNMVSEVILGVNFEKTNSKNKVEVFRYHMKKRWPKVKVSHSSLPINANPPYKPD